jgi:hypothetical protein
MKSIEVQLNEALTEIQQLKEVLIARTAEVRSYVLKQSGLPAPCVARIEKAFSKSIDNGGLKQAINAELRYLERVR